MNRSRVRLVASAAWRVGSTAIVAVAIIAALAFLAIAWDASHVTVTTTEVGTSPDGKWRSVLFVEKAGGTLGSCSQDVVIEAATEPVPTSERLEDLPPGSAVFSCSCGTDVRTTWRGATELEISYLVDDGVVTAHQRSRTSDGTVLLRYVVRGD
jgi:hypothetical protein